MGKRADRVGSPQNEGDIQIQDTHDNVSSDMERTRAEMSETIDAIQDRLAPERLTDEARDMATEVTGEAKVVVEEAIEKIKEAFPELTGQAEQVARDVIDHALQEAKKSLPVLSEQAQGTVDHIVDHAVQEAKDSLPVLSDQAQEAVDHIVDHAIQEAKAAIRELGTQARASVRDATIGKVERMADTTSKTSKSFSSSVVSTIKQNPGPAALTALGVGWLVMNGSGSGSQGTTSHLSGSTGSGMTDTVQAKAGEMQGKAGEMQDKAGDLAGQAQAAAANATDDVKNAATDVAGQVQDTASSVGSQVQDTATATADQIQDKAGMLSEKAQNLPGRLKHMIDTNPVPAGLVAVALGSTAAIMVPGTQREQQLLGGARDKLFEQAQSTSHDVVEKVKHVAEEAGEAVEKEAKYQGLSPDSDAKA
jgi:gas vesicle protein